MAGLSLAVLQGSAQGDGLGRRLVVCGGAERVAERVRGRVDCGCRMLPGGGRFDGAAGGRAEGTEGARGDGERDGADVWGRACRKTAWTLVGMGRLLVGWARDSASRQVRPEGENGSDLQAMVCERESLRRIFMLGVG